MIQNDTELKTSQQRIAYFQDLLLQLRVNASAEEFLLVSGGYRAENRKDASGSSGILDSSYI